MREGYKYGITERWSTAAALVAMIIASLVVAICNDWPPVIWLLGNLPTVSILGGVIAHILYRDTSINKNVKIKDNKKT